MNLFYREKVVYKALLELDEIFRMKGVMPFELNVIGGFALMIQNIRMSDYTDIDYIGGPMPIELREIIDEIGIRYNLGRGWINNDVLLSGSSLDELESVTGELKFNHAFDLSVITINSLDRLGLLRMKVIAIDTSFSGIELGGEFTRIKDFEDIKLLMDNLNMSVNDVVRETFDYVISPEIFYLIRYYVTTRDIDMFRNERMREIISNRGMNV